MLKYLACMCISVSLLFLFLGKTYSDEELSAANFLAENTIIHDWSRIPTKYKFNDTICLVDVLNISLSFHNISKNIDCRWDFSEVLSPYSIEWCRTFETAKDHGIISLSGEKKVSPLQNITYNEFMDIMIWDTQYTSIISFSKTQKLKRWEAFILLQDMYTKKSNWLF